MQTSQNDAIARAMELSLQDIPVLIIDSTGGWIMREICSRPRDRKWKLHYTSVQNPDIPHGWQILLAVPDEPEKETLKKLEEASGYPPLVWRP